MHSWAQGCTLSSNTLQDSHFEELSPFPSSFFNSSLTQFRAVSSPVPNLDLHFLLRNCLFKDGIG